MATARKPINLALQGGGSHGALTWGVLDRLLEDERLDIRALSGTSAGAMNAVVLADGFARDGAAGARAALAAFWKAVSEAARYSPAQRTWLDRLAGRYSLDEAFGFTFHGWTGALIAGLLGVGGGVAQLAACYRPGATSSAAA